MAAWFGRRRGGLLGFLLFLRLLRRIGRRALRGGRHCCLGGLQLGFLCSGQPSAGLPLAGLFARRIRKAQGRAFGRAPPRVKQALLSALGTHTSLDAPRSSDYSSRPTPGDASALQWCAPRRRRFPKTAGTWRVARRFVRAAPRTERPEESQRCSHCLGRRSLWARAPRLGCPQRPVLPTFELGARRTATRRAGRPPP